MDLLPHRFHDLLAQPHVWKAVAARQSGCLFEPSVVNGPQKSSKIVDESRAIPFQESYKKREGQGMVHHRPELPNPVPRGLAVQ